MERHRDANVTLTLFYTLQKGLAKFVDLCQQDISGRGSGCACVYVTDEEV